MDDGTSSLESELENLCAALRNAPDEKKRDQLVRAIRELAEHMNFSTGVDLNHAK